MADEARGAGGRQERDKIGEVQIADEVVAIIAGLAASEVDGVDSMGSGFFVQKLMQSTTSGVSL